MSFLNSKRIVIVVFALLSSLLLPHVTLASKPIGKVIISSGLFQGKVGSQEKRRLKRRSPIFERDTLTTDAKGYGQVRLLDGTLITIKPKTVYRIDSYVYKKGQANNKHKASIFEGGARTLTGLIKKVKPRDISLTTRVGILGVRGTEFDAQYLNKDLKLNVSGGVGEFTNQSGSYLIGDGQTSNSVLIGSPTSKPIILSVGEAVAAFNVEGIENQYLSLIGLNEALNSAALRQADFEIANLITSVNEGIADLFPNTPPNWTSVQIASAQRTLREDAWSTALTQQGLAVLNSDPAIMLIQNGGVIPGGGGAIQVPQFTDAFPRWSSRAEIATENFFAEPGRATDVGNGDPIFYTQFEAIFSEEMAAFVILPSAYIDPNPTSRGITTKGLTTADRFGTISHLSGAPIYWGRWNNVTGPFYEYLTQNETLVNPLGFSEIDAAYQWITFMPTSLNALRAVRGTRQYTQTQFSFGNAFYGQPIAGAVGPLLDTLPSDAITSMTSNFTLDFGSQGLGLGFPSGSMTINTSDGSQWLFRFEPGDGYQGGSNGFENIAGSGGTLTRPNGQPFGGDTFRIMNGNTFSAHSRVCGPHCPAAGFAGTIIGIRTDDGVTPLPDEATITGTFVLTTQ